MFRKPGGRRSVRAACALFVVIASASLLSGCGDDGLGGPDAQTLSRARERWQAIDLRYYTVEQRITCFCLPGAQFWHEITVSDDSVIAARRVEDATAGPLPAPSAPPEWFATVDELFRRIEARQRATDGSRVEVSYDAESGLPLAVDFLGAPGSADADVSYRLRALKPGLVQ